MHLLPPAEYVQTLTHATVYAALYVRDEADRPVQLRATYGTHGWLLPGGNLEPDEDPWEAAVREGIEETGLEHFRGLTPELLLTHFQHPDPAWPMPGVGFVFDGGRLTPEQLSSMRLDPAEHSRWDVRELAAWRPLMPPAGYERLAAVEAARTGAGPRLLISPGCGGGAVRGDWGSGGSSSRG
ncbi:NUDIX domain-containing protein [Streptomyces sp. TRM64462]|uniref:NUDIX domain-containing protein n=1 Tax=Streptomyces sp. TRM64462 TaxID=2741726 RepID=UPI0015862B4E|nr:NUDIX hydrolase [Streptomyces sp. TRM64462]